jgi:hypothetical protein
LLVLSGALIVLEEDLIHTLSVLLFNKVGGVEVRGSGAMPYAPENLLNWAVLGKNTDQDDFLSGVQKGCELFVGIKTPERNFLGWKTLDGKFDRYQFGEIGFELAKQNGIPALLLDHYDLHEILKFMDNELEVKEGR